MKIKTFLNTDLKEIMSKKFNIFIGISLGNKYYSKGNIKDYILWALKNTNKGVLVVVADEIHAINYRVLNNYSLERARKVALKKGDEIASSLKESQYYDKNTNYCSNIGNCCSNPLPQLNAKNRESTSKYHNQSSDKCNSTF